MIAIKLLALILLTSGAHALNKNIKQCSEWSDIINNEHSNEDVLKWADAHIFSRAFSRGDLMWGRLHGPGRMEAISLNRTGINLPDQLAGAEVRIIYLDSESIPGAVFIGHRSYEGLLIARSTLADVVANSEITAGAFPSLDERIGLVCVNQDR